MVASAGQLLAAGLHRGSERRVVLLLVAGAAQLPVGVRVGEVGHTVIAYALRVRPARRRLVDRGDDVSVVLSARGQHQQRHHQQRRHQTSSLPLSCHVRPSCDACPFMHTSSPDGPLGRREGFPNTALTPDHGMMGRCVFWWWRTNGSLPTRSLRVCATTRWPSTWPTTVMPRWSGWRSTTTTSSCSTATCRSYPGTTSAARWSNPAPRHGSSCSPPPPR